MNVHKSVIDLSQKERLFGGKHWTSEINQLYHPTGVFKAESFDMVYSFENLNTTKFTPILLKEWFNLVDLGGYLIIDYFPNKVCNFQNLEEYFLWLWKDKYEIVFHGLVALDNLKRLTSQKLFEFIKEKQNFYATNLDPITLLPPLSPTIEKPIEEGECIRFICKKIKTNQTKNDDINKWTFGIITDGKRRDWMEEIITSIRTQNIPNYEIIVCGTYYDRQEPNFVYIPFNQRRDKKWITKQKNMICQKAKYENVCILHNRLVLDNKWFTGMKKWGNCFEVLSLKQIQRETSKLGNHWEYNHFLFYRKMSRFFDKIILQFTATLDPRDWFENIIMYGQSIICKRSIYLEHKQNEVLYWDWAEDHAFSFELINSGYIMRYNPNSLMYNLDNKDWYNNVCVEFSRNAGTQIFKGPFIKLLYRNLVTTFFGLFKNYKFQIYR